MEEISKEEMQRLIRENILRMENGKYQDLTIVNKNKPARRKRRYVPRTFLGILEKWRGIF